ncbi:MAG TPA: TCR/Tet family MFS transporter [Spongiibacteraceae bacterium]|nr:TCR/Tet family MFS transporter [Spongiibacteraceae bacterium]
MQLTNPRKPAVIFIFITIVLDMLALGMIIPVLPKLVVDFAGGNTAHGALIFGLFGTAWALMQFIFSPLLGALSDRYGRRRVILISNFGLGCDYILMALAPNLHWLFIGRIISGITAASISTAYAYIADVTPADKRAGAFGLLGAAFGLGFVLGPGLGGILGSIDTHLPFWVAAGLSLLNALYGWLVLPESLAPAKRSGFSWKRANPFGALKLLREHTGLGGLAAVAFLSNLAHVVLPSTFVLYAGYRYGWNERDIGLTLAGVGVCSALVQGCLVRPFVARYGERTALLTGLSTGIIGFVIFGLAATGPVFLGGIIFSALWGFTGPAVQGLMTRRVGPSTQGRLQGANSSLTGIAQMLGPTLFTHAFASFIDSPVAGNARGWHLPGAPFLLAGLILCCALGLAVHSSRAG